MFPVPGVENGLVLVTTSDAEIFAITPPSRREQRYVEIEEPRGIVSSQIPGSTDSAMYVVGSGLQDKVFTFEMPESPEAPRWNTPRHPMVEIIPGTPVDITVPRAIASPPGTYSVGNTLPAAAAAMGIAFNANTLKITGNVSSTASGIGMIIVTCTNEYSTARYVIPYIIGVPAAPTFNVPSVSLNFVQGAPFNVTLPEATGFPEPTYSLSTNVIGGQFDSFNRKLTGVATNLGSFSTILYADNGQGTRAQLRVNYTVSAPTGNLVAPRWFTPTRETLHGQRGNPIQRVTFPMVDVGNPAPCV